MSSATSCLTLDQFLQVDGTLTSPNGECVVTFTGNNLLLSCNGAPPTSILGGGIAPAGGTTCTLTAAGLVINSTPPWTSGTVPPVVEFCVTNNCQAIIYAPGERAVWINGKIVSSDLEAQFIEFQATVDLLQTQLGKLRDRVLPSRDKKGRAGKVATGSEQAEYPHEASTGTHARRRAGETGS